MIPLKDNVGAGGAPVVTIALIVICVLVFLWQLTLSGAERSAGDREGDIVVGKLSERDEFAETYGTATARIAEDAGDEEFDQPPWWASPFTAIPVARDVLHLAINLLFLLILGRTLEVLLGRIRFVLLGAAAVATAIGVQALVDPGNAGLVLGASSLVAGLAGAHVALLPRAGVVTVSVIPGFGTVLEVPTVFMVAAWLAIGLIPAVGLLVDGGLLVGVGVEYVGYGAALLLGAALVRPLSWGRRVHDPTPASAPS